MRTARRPLVAAAIAAIALAAGPLGAPRAEEATGQVHGAVLGKDRKGAPGLPVAAILQGGGHLYGTSTDEAGRYAFKGLESGAYSLVVSLPGNGVLRKDGIRVRPLFRSIVDFTVGSDAPTAALPPIGPGAPAGGSSPVSIACTLVGPERAPAPDAWVLLTPADGAGRLRRGRTGPQGQCLLEEVPAGDYRITARAPGFITWVLGPIGLRGAGGLKLALSLVPFPMGFEGTLEDMLVPADPIPPQAD